MRAAPGVAAGATAGATTSFDRAGQGVLVLVVHAPRRAKIHLKCVWDAAGSARAEEEDVDMEQDGFLVHPVPIEKLGPGPHAVTVELNRQRVLDFPFEIR